MVPVVGLIPPFLGHSVDSRIPSQAVHVHRAIGFNRASASADGRNMHPPYTCPLAPLQDWRRISDETRQAATLRFQDELDIARIKEKNTEDKLKEEEAEEAKLTMYSEACVPEMFGGTIFEALLPKLIR